VGVYFGGGHYSVWYAVISVALSKTNFSLKIVNLWRFLSSGVHSLSLFRKAGVTVYAKAGDGFIYKGRRRGCLLPPLCVPLLTIEEWICQYSFRNLGVQNRCFFETRSCCVAQAGLELYILLSQTLKVLRLQIWTTMPSSKWFLKKIYLFYFYFLNNRVWTRGLSLARQVLCHLSHSTSLNFFFFFFFLENCLKVVEKDLSFKCPQSTWRNR
jgi:hypothetical protein